MKASTPATRRRARSAPAPDGAGTRDRILDVAERLFAERGLDGVSIRDITGEARANLGAINYHFGTKEGLIAAVFERRMAPLTEARLRGLDAVEAAAGRGRPKLEAVLEAVFRPVVEQSLDTRGGRPTFSRLLARLLLEPSPAVVRSVRLHFEPMIERFDAALMRAMPGLTREEVFWRMHVLIGALHHSWLVLDRDLPAGIARLRADPEAYLRRFVAFAAATFRAPLP